MLGQKTQDINSKVLKEARKALGMKQEELAELLGSHRTDISKLENGKKIPDWLMKSIILGRLLEKAGYSMDDLILSLPDPDSEASEVKP